MVPESAAWMGVDSTDLLAKLSQVLLQAVDHRRPGEQVADAGQGSGVDLGLLEPPAGKLLGANRG